MGSGPQPPVERRTAGLHLHPGVPEAAAQLGRRPQQSAAVEGLREAADYAADRGVTLALQNHAPVLRSGYEARSREELPVLVRWFEGVEPPVADYLVVILYSREQLAKEGASIEADWGVVGCLYTTQPEEIPMAPVTMMRNALGIAEGGSGVPLDREAYRRSVAFWEANANWRP